jgi:hypothetical protein
MPDAIRLLIFGLVSFIIGHTFSNKLKDESVASSAFFSDSTIVSLMVIRDRDLDKFPDSVVFRDTRSSAPYYLGKSKKGGGIDWIKSIGGSPFELPDRIIIDGYDNIYLIGVVRNQAYLVKFSKEGEQIWASFIPGLDIYRYYDVWIEGGRPVVEGYFNGQYYKTAVWNNKYIYWRN